MVKVYIVNKDKFDATTSIFPGSLLTDTNSNDIIKVSESEIMSKIPAINEQIQNNEKVILFLPATFNHIQNNLFESIPSHSNAIFYLYTKEKFGVNACSYSRAVFGNINCFELDSKCKNLKPIFKPADLTKSSDELVDALQLYDKQHLQYIQKNKKEKEMKGIEEAAKHSRLFYMFLFLSGFGFISEVVYSVLQGSSFNWKIAVGIFAIAVLFAVIAIVVYFKNEKDIAKSKLDDKGYDNLANGLVKASSQYEANELHNVQKNSVDLEGMQHNQSQDKNNNMQKN